MTSPRWISQRRRPAVSAWITFGTNWGVCSRWRHEMEIFSALLALCEGNPRTPVDSPLKDQWRGAFMFSFLCRINGNPSRTPAMHLVSMHHCLAAIIRVGGRNTWYWRNHALKKGLTFNHMEKINNSIFHNIRNFYKISQKWHFFPGDSAFSPQTLHSEKNIIPTHNLIIPAHHLE